ncbi:MAG: SIR2 family protein [Alphaproteobacteria bacterium]|nr:SIR2 family protein [Alphaproteobacteria bacterium]
MTALDDIAAGIRDGWLVPWLGPEILTLDGPPPIPTSTRALAERLVALAPVPGRIRGNVWSSAQYIESHQHRMTLVRLIGSIFAPRPEPNALHRWLAAIAPPLVIEGWYDSTMARAMAGRDDWGLVQAVTRNGEWKDVWYRTLTPAGEQVADETAEGWGSLIYKPHGGVEPAGSFLLSDSDYVEVLTEIDIQTPIPPVVRALRATRGFVFLGCRFRDQMERMFATQIMKRSAGPHFAVIEGDLTRNEARFLARQDIRRIDLPLDVTVARLTGAACANAPCAA